MNAGIRHIPWGRALAVFLCVSAVSCGTYPVPASSPAPPPPAAPAVHMPEPPPPPPAPVSTPAGAVTPNLPPSLDVRCQPCSVIPGSKLVLSSRAADPEGGSVRLTWQTFDGAIEDPSAAMTTWVAPNREGRYAVQLTARDEFGATSTRTIMLAVAVPSAPPAAGGRAGGRGGAPPASRFPWPPPAWTSVYEIPAAAVWGNGNATYGAAFDAMKAALQRGGFPGWRVYELDDEGFAVVAHMETINDRGEPLPGDARWLANPPMSLWDLSAVLRRLATAERGRYRLIVLLCTARPLQTGPGAPEMVLPLVSSGGISISPGLMQQPVPSRPTVAALVYEFRKTVGRDPVHLQFAQSGLHPRDHLLKALLWTPEVLR